ncbi:MAG: hypothetical protein NTU51_10965 [Bacteroidetes bacterium]|nr:hypothetical protein [Bacteroidota bacterium]
MLAQLSLQRLWWLIIRQLTINTRMYLGILGVMSLFLFYLGIIDSHGHIIQGMYPFALSVGVAFISGNCYKKWSDAGHASTLLMIPASITEKFFTNIIIGILLVIPVLTLLYFLEGYIFLNICHGPVTFTDLIPGNDKSFFNEGGHRLDNFFSGYFWITIMTFLLIQPLFLVAAARIKKLQFQAGVLAVILVFTFGVFSNIMLLHNLSHELSFNYIYFFVGGQLGYLDMSLQNGTGQFIKVGLQPWIYILNQCVYLVLSALLYVAAWFSLKEREI